MLRYIPLALLSIDYPYLVVNQYVGYCLVSTDTDEQCREWMYKYITSRGSMLGINWMSPSKHLLKLIINYSIPSNIAKRRITDYTRYIPFSSERSAMVKLFIAHKLLDKEDINFVKQSVYSELVIDDRDEIMTSIVNNFMELAYSLFTAPKDEDGNITNLIECEDDNRSTIDSILIYKLYEGNNIIESWLCYAYIINALPDYIPAKYKNDIAIQAVISHFTGVIYIKDSIPNRLIYYVAAKFEFSSKLLYRCVELNQISNIRPKIPNKLQHQIQIATDKINRVNVELCNQCPMCNYIKNL